MERILEKLGMRTRLILSFGLVLLVAMLGTTLSINYYNHNFISGLLEQNNSQQMKEINYELNGLYDKVNQIFITFNNEQLYEMFRYQPHLSDFEQMKQRLDYEHEVKETINGNNMQSVVTGVIFYINEDKNAYVGSGPIQKNFSFQEADWYRKFRQSGSLKLMYGPLTEDFRPENITKNEAIYYMRAWNVPSSSGFRQEEKPFILFSINMDYIRDIFGEYAQNSRGYLISDKEENVLAGINLTQAQEEEVAFLIENHREDLGRTGTFLNREWFVDGVTNDQFGWHIYSVESTQDTFRDMNRIIRNINLIILGTGIAAMALTVVFSSRIMMPITLLNKLISTIEEENDTFIQVKSNDELGQIGNRFNQMKRKLQEMSANMYLSRVQDKEAQLSALQSQINPHFLYNTLDNIYCIAQIEEVDSIVLLTENLSNMMRYSCDMKNHRVPLAKEIEHVKAYVSIINMRFDDSITLECCVEAPLLQVSILKLTLQPLVENAWSHGILPKDGHRGIIRIDAEVREEALIVTVTDDGVGITPEKSRELNAQLSEVNYEAADSEKGSGVALKNVNNRIKLSDGPEYGLTLFPAEGGGCRVVMKVKRKQNE